MIDNYRELSSRIYADFDNERPYELNVVGLSQTDYVIDFTGKKIKIYDGDYIYLYMDVDSNEYVVSEGVVFPNPYTDLPYKWCCRLSWEIEYMEQYTTRLGTNRSILE